MADIFLSYSREDHDVARRCAELLEREGFSVWWDQTLRSGEAYDEITEQALRSASAVVVLWSKRSVASRWVRAEATIADRAGRLMPAMIEPCDRPVMFELRQTADLTGWRGDADDARWRGFIADVRARVSPAAPAPLDGNVAANERPVGGEKSPRRYRLAGLALILAIALIGAAAVVWKYWPGVTPAAARVPVTLAVLPFANLAEDPGQDYFSDGLTEEILNQLAQVPDLRVTGRTSSFSFKGRNEDLRAIARQLGVAHLLEGSIRKQGQTLRITAQLVDGANGAHLWSRSYDREMRDVFALQEEVAKDVTRALSIRLDVGDTRRASGGTTNVQAYETSLRARADFHQRRFPDAVRVYREAVAQDPQFVSAWYGLAQALLPLNATAARLGEIAQRLESIAPGAWQTQMVKAMQLRQSRQWLAADAALEQSAPRAEASVTTAAGLDGLALLGLERIWVGRLREAEPYFRRLLESDPFSELASGWLQYVLIATGRLDEALAEEQRLTASITPADRSAVAVPGSTDLGRLLGLLEANRLTEAQLRARLAPYAKAEPLVDRLTVALDHSPAAKAALQQAFENAGPADTSRLIWVATIADRLDDRDLAIAALRKIYVDLGFRSNQYLWLPFRSGVRSDPRMKSLLSELDLVSYWRTTNHWPEFCRPVRSDDFECR